LTPKGPTAQQVSHLISEPIPLTDDEGCRARKREYLHLRKTDMVLVQVKVPRVTPLPSYNRSSLRPSYAGSQCRFIRFTWPAGSSSGI
jgi:hypothetical protein